jgi:hypothetical protein
MATGSYSFRKELRSVIGAGGVYRGRSNYIEYSNI